jgi:LAGLIDADG DNA endonuclease family
MTKYKQDKDHNKKIVIYGSNCGSTVGLKYSSLIKKIQKIPLSHISTIIGILLSDANLSKGTNINARLQFKQSLKNIRYFYSVYTKLNHYCNKEAYLTLSIIKNKKHLGIAFTSRTLPCFTELYYIFYNSNKKKIVPLNLYDFLTWEALAHWIMCDGTYNSGIRIQTESFTLEEVISIISLFKLKFNLDCTIHFQRNKPIIYIKSKSIKKNLSHLLPFMHPDMLYKVLGRKVQSCL